MGIFKGDLQILLYTKETEFVACREFYQVVLGQEPYYTWDESISDRGAKFRAGRGTISVLCQDHQGNPGPVNLNLEAVDVDKEFSRLNAMNNLNHINVPKTTSYGTRFFTITDPIGNRINIYHSDH